MAYVADLDLLFSILIPKLVGMNLTHQVESLGIKVNNESR
jgi:hypothetical protein